MPVADIEKVIETRLRASAQLVAVAAKDICPVDTGRLRASIHVIEVTPEYADIGTFVPYGGFVEYGTRKMSAQPYLRPALTLVENDLKKIWSG